MGERTKIDARGAFCPGPLMELIATLKLQGAKVALRALMLRTDHSWHAVRPIECPEDRLRRVFIVVVNPNNLFWKVRDRVIGKTIQRF